MASRAYVGKVARHLGRVERDLEHKSHRGNQANDEKEAKADGQASKQDDLITFVMGTCLPALSINAQRILRAGENTKTASPQLAA